MNDEELAIKYDVYFERVYQACIRHFGLPKEQKDTALCVVIHAFDNIFPYMELLNRHFHLGAIIFKGSKEIHPQVIESAIARGLSVRPDLSRASLIQIEAALDLMDSISDKGKKNHIIVHDYGGYFSPCHPVLSKHKLWRHRYLGVIEGTENGHQRYQNLFEKPQLVEKPNKPVISNARSVVKNCYDAHIGYSIVAGSQYALHHSKDRRLDEFECIGMLGYGKIGRSTAFYLHNIHRDTKIKVCDVSPDQLVLAQNDGFETLCIEELINQCTFIYSITGNAALKPQHFDSICNKGLTIACGTSPDDELNIHQLKQDKVLIATDESKMDDNGICVSQIYQTRGGGEINLLGDGRTINSLMVTGSHHPTLALSEGLYITQALALIANRHSQYKHCISMPDEEMETMVIKLWLEEFANNTILEEALQLSLLDTKTMNAIYKAEAMLVQEEVLANDQRLLKKLQT